MGLHRRGRAPRGARHEVAPQLRLQAAAARTAMGRPGARQSLGLCSSLTTKPLGLLAPHVSRGSLARLPHPSPPLARPRAAHGHARRQRLLRSKPPTLQEAASSTHACAKLRRISSSARSTTGLRLGWPPKPILHADTAGTRNSAPQRPAHSPRQAPTAAWLYPSPESSNYGGSQVYPPRYSGPRHTGS